MVRAIRLHQDNYPVIARTLKMQLEEVYSMFTKNDFETRESRYVMFDFEVKDSDLVLPWVTIKGRHLHAIYNFDKLRVEKEVVTIKKKAQYDRPADSDRDSL